MRRTDLASARAVFFVDLLSTVVWCEQGALGDSASTVRPALTMHRATGTRRAESSISTPSSLDRDWSTQSLQGDFRLLNQRRPRHVERTSDTQKQAKRRLPLPAFKLPVVRPVNARLEGELILCQVLRLAQRTNNFTKSARCQRLKRCRAPHSGSLFCNRVRL